MPRNKAPQRRCIACMESKDQDSLIRISLWEGHLVLDPDGKSPGRGSYICDNEDCLSVAEKKNSFSRSYRRAIPAEESKRIIEEIRALREG